MAARPEINILSTFSGIGALDLAVSSALRALGFGARACCYCEREAHAAAALVARMEDASLDPGPVWDDIRTFDGRPWCGLVDLLIGGPPCQPYSLAGKRRGCVDRRSYGAGDGPIPHLLRVIAECRPSVVFLENVPAWLSGGHFRRFGEELSGLGYAIEEPLFFAAQDVGAPHRRERVFVMAHRDSPRKQKPARAEREVELGAAGAGDIVGHHARIDQRHDRTRDGESQEPHRGSGCGLAGPGFAMGDSCCAGSPIDAGWRGDHAEKFAPSFGDGRNMADLADSGCRPAARTQPESERGCRDAPDHQHGGEAMADDEHRRRNEGAQAAGRTARSDALGSGECVGAQAFPHADGSGCGERRLAEGEHEIADQGDPLFPPGVDDPRWMEIIRALRWDLLPAFNPAALEEELSRYGRHDGFEEAQRLLRRMADGNAHRVVRLRAVGNAVVPLQAALAFYILWSRAFG